MCYFYLQLKRIFILYFDYLVNSQDLVIGDPATDTENDFSDPPESPYHFNTPDEQSDQPDDNMNNSHMDFSGAMAAIRAEQNVIGSQQQSMMQDSDIDWNDYMNMPGTDHPEDDEFPIDRQLRILNEEEEEQRAGLTGRLTAPEHEIRRRQRRSKSINQDDTTAQLRAKQIELVEEQLKLHKTLSENAAIAKEEAKERLKMVATQRKIAELDLRLKEMEFNAKEMEFNANEMS